MGQTPTTLIANAMEESVCVGYKPIDKKFGPTAADFRYTSLEPREYKSLGEINDFTVKTTKGHYVGEVHGVPPGQSFIVTKAGGIVYTKFGTIWEDNAGRYY